MLSREGCQHARGLQEIDYDPPSPESPGPVRTRRGWAGGRGCGEYRRSRWDGKEGLRGERKEDHTLECAEGKIEGAKQRQVKESGGSYRKGRMGCGVDEGGKGG